MRPERFHLLFVCTANICRSPIAAELTRRRLRAATRPDAGHILVGSAGIRGRDGAAMDPGAEAVLRPLGGRPSGFTSRRLTAEMVAAAHLILAAQRPHRAAVVALVPRAHARVFTIREFARLVRAVDPDRLPADGIVPRALALVREAARLRGVCPPPMDEEGIADPHGRPLHAYRACAIAIDDALEPPLRLLLDGSPASGPDGAAGAAGPAVPGAVSGN